MSIEDNKKIARRFTVDVWGKADMAAADEIVHPDITVSYPVLPETVHGLEAFKEVLRMVQTGLPDAEATADEVIAEGDKVVVRWTFTGTHLGPLGSIPATGKRVRWTGISIGRLIDGKVIEDRGEEDALGLMQQLGVVPAPEQAPA